MHSGVVSPEVTYGMTRVIGSSMARVASALIDAVSAQRPGGGSAQRRRARRDLEPIAAEAGGFLPDVPGRCSSRCGAATSRPPPAGASCGATPEGGRGLVVGFADLVGFTALAQQVSDEELAEVVDQFERLAYDVVVAGGGRVVKMIGDEVMFLVEDPVAAAEIALGLADASRDAAELSDVRVGLALGPVLEREGDAYGATVNLASRATRHRLPRHGGGVARAARRSSRTTRSSPSGTCARASSRTSGGCPSPVLRREGEGPSSIREAIDERRKVMRDAVRDRLTMRGSPEDDDAAADDREVSSPAAALTAWADPSYTGPNAAAMSSGRTS